MPQYLVWTMRIRHPIRKQQIGTGGCTPRSWKRSEKHSHATEKTQRRVPVSYWLGGSFPTNQIPKQTNPIAVAAVVAAAVDLADQRQRGLLSALRMHAVSSKAAFCLGTI